MNLNAGDEPFSDKITDYSSLCERVINRRGSVGHALTYLLASFPGLSRFYVRLVCAKHEREENSGLREVDVMTSGGGALPVTSAHANALMHCRVLHLRRGLTSRGPSPPDIYLT